MSFITITPAVTASSAYTSGNNVGGLLTLTGAILQGGGAALLQSLTVTDKANQKAAMTLLLFDSNPGSGTYTDKVAMALATDLIKIAARVDIAAADYVTIDSKAIAQYSNLQRIVVALAGANTPFGALVTTSPPTYARVSDLQ